MTQAQTHPLYEFADLIFRDKAEAAARIKADPSLLELTLPNTKETVLHFLVIENFIAEAQFLLEQGAKADTTDSGFATPLIHAAMLGYREMAALLIAHGANVNHQDQVMHYTPLHYAAQRSDIETVKLLLGAGADKNISDGLDGTPLDVAYKTYLRLAEFLA